MSMNDIRIYNSALGLDGTIPELVERAISNTKEFSNEALEEISKMADYYGLEDKYRLIPELLIKERKAEHSRLQPLGTFQQAFVRLQIDHLLDKPIRLHMSDLTIGDTKINELEVKEERVYTANETHNSIRLSFSGIDPDNHEPFHASVPFSMDEFMFPDEDLLYRTIGDVVYYKYLEYDNPAISTDRDHEMNYGIDSVEPKCYMSLNNKYIVCSEPIAECLFSNKVYDKNLDLLASTTTEGGFDAKDNAERLMEEHILFRPFNDSDTYQVLDNEIVEARINDRQILNNALELNHMEKAYEILNDMCKRYDFLSLDINEKGITVCCSAYSEEKNQMEQRPWVEISPSDVNIVGNAAELGLYFDSTGHDAFEVTRAELVDITDRIGEACNIGDFDRVPTLLPLMVDRDTYNTCSKWNPSPDYDRVIEAAREMDLPRPTEEIHQKRHQNNEITMSR